MNDSNELENLLRSAPRPPVPEHLLACLKADIKLSEPSQQRAHIHRRFDFGRWVPVFSIAAAAILLVVSLVLFFPASTAYSFQKTVESLREVSSIHVLHRFRIGPPQPLPESANGEGTTTFHPANGFAEAEIITATQNGRALSFTRSSIGLELIRNGPLGLLVNTETKYRKFFLGGSADLSGFDPAKWFIEMEKSAQKGEIQYEIPDRPDADGNLKIVIRHPLLDENEWFVLWVDVQTNLPILIQQISSAFPHYGEQVLMAEWRFLKFGGIDPQVFEIVPTVAELERWGLQREDIRDLPLSAISIEISGEEGLPVVGTIRDDHGRRKIAGTLPMNLVEAPQGKMIIDLHAEDENRHDFEAIVGGSTLSGLGQRIEISLHEDGSAEISVTPLNDE